MAIEFKYSRFANLADMTEFAVKVAIAHNESETRENKAFAESGIYSDNSDLSHRAQVSIVCDNVVHVLRWNAFCDQPDIEHMGKRSRRDARDAADWFTNQIQAAIDQFKQEILELNGKRFARSESAFVESLFHAGGTCAGFFVPHSNEIEIQNMQGEKIAVINREGVLCHASRLDDGRFWYSHATVKEIGQWGSYSQGVAERKAAIAKYCGRPASPARAALSRAVNRAIENGAPVIAEIPYWERPCAAAGLTSYRCRSPYGFVMIGATDDGDAMKQALRSTSKPEALERWNGAAYQAV